MKVHEHLQQAGQASTFHKYYHKEEIGRILSGVALDAAAHRRRVFVHFDCHGNEDGIAATNQEGQDELVTWGELRPWLREIFSTTGNKPILCLSSCKGFNAVKLVPSFEPCPYEYVTGSFEEIGFEESVKGYNLFYDGIISGLSIKDAALAVHNTPELKALKFVGLSAHALLEFAIDAYIEKECTPERLASKKEEAKKLLLSMGVLLDQAQLLELNYLYSIEGQMLYIDRMRNASAS